MSNLPFDELDEQTIKLLNDAGITPVKSAYSFNARINKLVAVVRANEREACALLCEEQDEYGCGQYAKAIRARGNQ